MTIAPITNGESGSSVRTKLNSLIASVSGLNVSTVTASAAQLQTLFSAPLELVPAQGAGNTIVPLAIAFKRGSPATSIGSATATLDYHLNQGSIESDIGLNFAQFLLQGEIGGNVIGPACSDSNTGLISNWSGAGAGWPENEALVLSCDANAVSGTVATVAVGNSGGAGYAVNDTVFVQATGYVTYKITAVDGGGAVTGIVVQAGSEDQPEDPGNNLVTNTGGGGAGLTLDITVNPATGDCTFTTVYLVI